MEPVKNRAIGFLNCTTDAKSHYQTYRSRKMTSFITGIYHPRFTQDVRWYYQRILLTPPPAPFGKGASRPLCNPLSNVEANSTIKQVKLRTSAFPIFFGTP